MFAQDKKTIEILFTNIDNLRDAAIIAVLFESGGRLAEIANIQETDISWEKRQIRAIAKGNKEVLMPLGLKSLNLLKLWVKEYHPKSGNVWGVNKNGIVSMLRRLEKKSGVICNAHTFRRGFASQLRRDSVDTLDIMNLGHWSSPEMVKRYTESVGFEDSQMRYKDPLGKLEDSGKQHPGDEMVPRPGIGPGTRRFSVYCSTD